MEFRKLFAENNETDFCNNNNKENALFIANLSTIQKFANVPIANFFFSKL